MSTSWLHGSPLDERFDRFHIRQLTNLRYVRTPILPQAVQDYLEERGVGFALVEDCCKAVLKIASDTTVNGIHPK